MARATEQRPVNRAGWAAATVPAPFTGRRVVARTIYRRAAQVNEQRAGEGGYRINFLILINRRLIRETC